MRRDGSEPSRDSAGKRAASTESPELETFRSRKSPAYARRLAVVCALALACPACGGDSADDVGSGKTSDGTAGPGGSAGAGARGGGVGGGDAGGGPQSGDGGAVGQAGEGGAGGAGSFCATLGSPAPEVLEHRCLDFDGSGSAAEFTVEGGTWQVADGKLVGTGPDEAISCKDEGFGMTAAVLTGFSASAVRVHVELTGVDRADKIVVLRSSGSENRIELNFRSIFESGGETDGGDLVVQEIVDCAGTFRVPPRQVLIPHELDQTIDVDVELRAQRLMVWIDGAVVMDEVFESPGLLSELPGSAGVGVNTGGTVRFDDLVVQAFDPSPQ